MNIYVRDRLLHTLRSEVRIPEKKMLLGVRRRNRLEHVTPLSIVVINDADQGTKTYMCTW